MKIKTSPLIIVLAIFMLFATKEARAACEAFSVCAEPVTLLGASSGCSSLAAKVVYVCRLPERFLWSFSTCPVPPTNAVALSFPLPTGQCAVQMVCPNPGPGVLGYLNSLASGAWSWAGSTYVAGEISKGVTLVTYSSQLLPTAVMGGLITDDIMQYVLRKEMKAAQKTFAKVLKSQTNNASPTKTLPVLSQEVKSSSARAKSSSGAQPYLRAVLKHLAKNLPFAVFKHGYRKEESINILFEGVIPGIQATKTRKNQWPIMTMIRHLDAAASIRDESEKAKGARSIVNDLITRFIINEADYERTASVKEAKTIFKALFRVGFSYQAAGKSYDDILQLMVGQTSDVISQAKVSHPGRWVRANIPFFSREISAEERTLFGNEIGHRMTAGFILCVGMQARKLNMQADLKQFGTETLLNPAQEFWKKEGTFSKQIIDRFYQTPLHDSLNAEEVFARRQFEDRIPALLKATGGYVEDLKDGLCA